MEHAALFEGLLTKDFSSLTKSLTGAGEAKYAAQWLASVSAEFHATVDEGLKEVLR